MYSKPQMRGKPPVGRRAHVLLGKIDHAEMRYEAKSRREVMAIDC